MLTKDRRENLLPCVKEARRVVEDAFDRALAGLGLFNDRDPLPIERIADPAKREVRAAIDEVLARDLQSGGLDYAASRRRYVEHCAFTLVSADHPPIVEDDEAFGRDQVVRLISYAVKLTTAADDDGVIPIARIAAEPTLCDRVKTQFAIWFGEDQVESKWAEAGEILGKPVEEWLAEDYFAFHVDMYRRRPIFWQFTSAYCVPRGSLPGAFSCLIHYHKLQGNTLQNILAHYLVHALSAAQAQFDATKALLESQQQRGATRRELTAAQKAFNDADKRLRELVEFQRRLQELDTGARPVSPPPGPDDPWLKQKIAEVTGGPAYGGRGWLPVIDYGVRVNIEPLKVARVLHRAADRIQ